MADARQTRQRGEKDRCIGIRCAADLATVSLRSARWRGERVSPRATLMHQKTSRPVKFEITQPARAAVGS